MLVSPKPVLLPYSIYPHSQVPAETSACSLCAKGGLLAGGRLLAENLISRGQEVNNILWKNNLASDASFWSTSLEQLLGSPTLFLMMEDVFVSTACIWVY